MNLRTLPVLLVAVLLLLAGGIKLLGDDRTSEAGAGALLGAGLLVLGLWVAHELKERRDAVPRSKAGEDVEDHPPV